MALTAAGIDVTDALRSGAFLERTHAEVHRAGGRFGCERMLGLLNEAVEPALNDGFKGLRTPKLIFQECTRCGDVPLQQTEPAQAWIDGAFATHPSVVSAGRHQRNPAYDSRVGGAKTSK